MLFLTFSIGLITSYLGMITPSMLNITALKISLEKGKKQAINYAVGVATIVIFQGFFALYFLKVILNNPIILETLESVAVFLFAILSFFFFRKAIQEKKQMEVKPTNLNGLLTGIGLSTINLFAIPFYCTVGAIINMYGYLPLELIDILLFVLGSTLGTFLILYNYIILAEKIKPRIIPITKYLNFILGGITGIVALITFIKIL